MYLLLIREVAVSFRLCFFPHLSQCSVCGVSFPIALQITDQDELRDQFNFEYIGAVDVRMSSGSGSRDVICVDRRCVHSLLHLYVRHECCVCSEVVCPGFKRQHCFKHTDIAHIERLHRNQHSDKDEG